MAANEPVQNSDLYAYDSFSGGEAVKDRTTIFYGGVRARTSSF